MNVTVRLTDGAEDQFRDVDKGENSPRLQNVTGITRREFHVAADESLVITKVTYDGQRQYDGYNRMSEVSRVQVALYRPFQWTAVRETGA